MSYLFLCLFSVFDTKSNFAVASMLGSDSINILFVFGVILYRQRDECVIDNWLYIRDSLYYLIGVILLATFYMLESLTWYFAFILVGYYFIFYAIQSKNDSVKEAVYILLGFKQDDDSFNAEEHYNYKKRRDSITYLKESDYIDRGDQTLQKKLNRTEAILKINFKGIF
jgi:Ca2+/Na+ antiporter